MEQQPLSRKGIQPPARPQERLLELDEDGYPTSDSLDLIDTWPSEEFPDLLKQIEGIWAYHDFGWGGLTSTPPKEVQTLLYDAADKDCLWLRLATAGWSGNESIIAALKTNRLFSFMHWFMSARGGLHIYRFNKYFLTPDARVENNVWVQPAVKGDGLDFDDFDLLVGDGKEFDVEVTDNK